MRTQWRMVRLVVAQKLTGLERCFDGLVVKTRTIDAE